MPTTIPLRVPAAVAASSERGDLIVAICFALLPIALLLGAVAVSGLGPVTTF